MTMNINPIPLAARGIERTQAPAGESAAPPTEAPGLMPEIDKLQCSGDPGAMLAALSMESAKTQSDQDRQQRDAAMRAQTNAEAAEIQDLHDKASLQRAQGWTDGVLQIAQGAFDFAKGWKEADASVDQGKDASTDKKWVAGLGAGVAGCKAAQSAADGEFSGAITDKDAAEKMHEASANTFKQMVEDARDDQKDAKELMAKALEFYKEYSETRAQTMMAATHRA